MRTLSLVLLLTLSSFSNAALILSSDGSEVFDLNAQTEVVFETNGIEVIAAYNIPVLGLLFDVQFVTAPGDFLFESMEPVAQNVDLMQAEADARQLAQALLDFVFVDVPTFGNLDDNVGLLAICNTTPSECQVMTAYRAILGQGVDGVIVSNFPEFNSPPDEIRLGGIGGRTPANFANWIPSANRFAVPTPPALTLMLFGLAVLVFFRQKSVPSRV